MRLNLLKKITGAALLLASIASHAAPTAIPEHSQPVVDLTGTLAQDVLGGLNAKADALKAKTGVQIAVLLTSSLNGETLDAFSERVAQAWKLGDKDAKSVLLTVAFSDHGVRLVATRNLADHLDVNRANDVINNALVPEFRQGHIPKGISSAMDAVESDLTGPAILFSQGVKIAPAAQPSTAANTATVSPASSTLLTATAGNSFVRLLGGDALALGLVGSALVCLVAFFTYRRIRSDQALRRSIMRAHVEKSTALQARSGSTLSRQSALDKATAGKPAVFTGSVAKSRLSGLRQDIDTMGPQAEQGSSEAGAPVVPSGNDA
jgi:uncharacterized membrane protein YgcG